MAYSKLFASLAMLMAMQPMFSNGDNISPSLSPLFDNICDEVNCGRGTCEVALGRPFNFICRCDAGWNRTIFDDNNYDDNLHQFLPCTVPNCTLDYSCMPAPPPAPPAPPKSFNLSFFDPCSWIYCGQGTCTKNHTYTHTCQCNPGYYNLQNITAFPCFSECAIGSECSRLGVRVSNSSSSSSPGGGSQGQTDGGSLATSFLPGKFQWATIILISAAMALLS